jgi:response regulator RpfG family c-di-GMP phosphodiesterase
MVTERVKVLCVDDEPQILQGLGLHLRRGYDLATAANGAAGLEILRAQGPFAVVLSDMRMPGMDGAAFLTEVRSAAPDTTRMLLTGHADMSAAIAAVNQGQIFRFLMKPCPPPELLGAFQAAAEQYRLVTAERVLLEQTVRGAIRMLTDILSLASPVAFGRAERVARHVGELSEALQLEQRWQVEVAARLSQLGGVAVPDDVLRRHYSGETLDPSEQAMIARIPAVTDSFLANIPRLEPVREILARHSVPYAQFAGKCDALAVAASVLRVAVEFDELDSRGVPTQTALETIRGREGAHDPSVVGALARLRGAAAGAQEMRVRILDLRPGMVLVEDLRARSGLLLVARGFQVTDGLIEKLRNFSAGHVREPIRVIPTPRCA